MKRTMFECPYDTKAKSCQHMNTSLNTISFQKNGKRYYSCIDCDWYNSGIRPSRGTPILGYIQQFFNEIRTKK